MRDRADRVRRHFALRNCRAEISPMVPAKARDIGRPFVWASAACRSRARSRSLGATALSISAALAAGWRNP